MKCVDWATMVWKTELNEDSTISIPSLCAYFRYNIGDLNNLLGTCFRLDQNTIEVVDENGKEIDREAANIYKYIYLISFYGRQIRANLGVGGVTSVMQISSDGGTVRLTDKTSIGKAYIQMRKDTESTLNRMVNKYKFRNQNAQQVVGDDIYVSPNTYSARNTDGTLYNRDII